MTGMPEIIDAVKANYRVLDKDTVSRISDKSSAIANISMVIGNIFGPIVGGTLNDKLGYRSTTTVVAIVELCLFLFYLVFGICCGSKP